MTTQEQPPQAELSLKTWQECFSSLNEARDLAQASLDQDSHWHHSLEISKLMRQIHAQIPGNVWTACLRSTLSYTRDEARRVNSISTKNLPLAATRRAHMTEVLSSCDRALKLLQELAPNTENQDLETAQAMLRGGGDPETLLALMVQQARVNLERALKAEAEVQKTLVD
jgi:hypothetical protein